LILQLLRLLAHPSCT